jgi:hypothetical protein
MDKIAVDYKDKGVEFYNLYTREPHAGEDRSKRNGDKRYDWTNVPQTKTMGEREDYALKMIKDFNQVRPILIDIFPDSEKGIKTVQKWLGGGAPNSGIVIDRNGKMVFWQDWAKPNDLRENIEKLLAAEKK